jgi:hypothetical protein
MDGYKTYTCAACQGTFTSIRPDSEAEKEAEELFGVKNASSDSSMACVCDNCYQELMRIGIVEC